MNPVIETAAIFSQRWKSVDEHFAEPDIALFQDQNLNGLDRILRKSDEAKTEPYDGLSRFVIGGTSEIPNFPHRAEGENTEVETERDARIQIEPKKIGGFFGLKFENSFLGFTKY